MRIPPPDTRTCEVKIGGAWVAMGLAAARAEHGSDAKRCPACRGAVKIVGTYSGPATRLSLAHVRGHDGCPLMPARFGGTASPHPEAVA